MTSVAITAFLDGLPCEPGTSASCAPAPAPDLQQDPARAPLTPCPPPCAASAPAQTRPPPPQSRRDWPACMYSHQREQCCGPACRAASVGGAAGLLAGQRQAAESPGRAAPLAHSPCASASWFARAGRSQRCAGPVRCTTRHRAKVWGAEGALCGLRGFREKSTQEGAAHNYLQHCSSPTLGQLVPGSRGPPLARRSARALRGCKCTRQLKTQESVYKAHPACNERQPLAG